MPGGGPHPDDAALFAPDQLPALRAAVEELRYLRERSYALPGALKLVGDRHQLGARQRIAIRRATSAPAGVAARAQRRLPPEAPAPAAVWIDGFNAVITCETALRGGVLVTTLDGTLRDLAGIHGSYRLSAVTDQALAVIADQLERRGWRATPTRWLLDAPVSNTGRLAARIRALAGARELPWDVEVVPDPDPVLAAAPAEVAVASGDAVILDACAGPWLDLGAEAVQAGVPAAWTVDIAGAP